MSFVGAVPSLILPGMSEIRVSVTLMVVTMFAPISGDHIAELIALTVMSLSFEICRIVVGNMPWVVVM